MASWRIQLVWKELNQNPTVLCLIKTEEEVCVCVFVCDSAVEKRLWESGGLERADSDIIIIIITRKPTETF